MTQTGQCEGNQKKNRNLKVEWEERWCLSLGPIAVMKYRDEKQVGEDRVIWVRLIYHCSPPKEVKTETPTDRDLEAAAVAEAMVGAVYWLAHHG